MFHRTESRAPHTVSGNETIIAQGVRVEGDFTSEGDVIIEGEVTGSVKTAQHLRVGQAAKIQAEVSASDAVVAGEVRGNLTVAGKLELLETSQVHGDIQADVLSVSPGAKINGRVTMGNDRVLEGKRVRGKRQEQEEEVVTA